MLGQGLGAFWNRISLNGKENKRNGPGSILEWTWTGPELDNDNISHYCFSQIVPGIRNSVFDKLISSSGPMLNLKKKNHFVYELLSVFNTFVEFHLSFLLMFFG